MKPIASVLSIIALGFGLLGCPSDEGVSSSLCSVDNHSRFRCGRQCLYFNPRGHRRNGPVHLDCVWWCLAGRFVSQCQHGCR